MSEFGLEKGMLAHQLADTEQVFAELGNLASVDAEKLEKVVLARKVGQFLTQENDRADCALVGNVARVLADDVSELVRQTLAFELRESTFVPRDVADKIVHDIENVSGPFLCATTIFTDSELADLAAELEEWGRIAIARRSTVPGVVSEALSEHGGSKVVGQLLRNRGAELTEKACETVVERFEGDNRILDQLAERPDLPLKVARALVEIVSENLRGVLVNYYDLGDEGAGAVLAGAQTKSFVEILENAAPEELGAYVRDLQSKGDLTPNLVLTVTQHGNLTFFELAMAALLDVPRKNIRQILNSRDESALTQMLSHADIPSSYHRMIQNALDRIRLSAAD